MRRTAAAFLILALVLSWSACGVKGPPLPPENTVDVSTAASDVSTGRTR